MAPPIVSLYTLSFFLALAATLFVAASLRLLAILPRGRFQPKPLPRKLTPTRILIVLGSGGHTHEMFYLLRNLDTRKYTHRTYVVSSGDAFSAQRAVEFESEIEMREKNRASATKTAGNGRTSTESANSTDDRTGSKDDEQRKACVGPSHYDISIIPRARRIHQSLFTTPFTSLSTLLSSLRPLLSCSTPFPDQSPQDAYEAAARDLPDLIITNGPATAVIVIIASLILKFFDVKAAQTRGKCKSVYVESFARVKGLSLSGKLLLKVVDRFLVQWDELEGKGGRAEFWGVLV